MPGLDLKTLQETYERDLFVDYLPFLDRHVIDERHGGFLCDCTALGERLSDRKRTWFEGRGMWTYAVLYRDFTKDQRHLDVALRSYDLLTRTRPTGSELRPADLNRDGSAAGPPDVQVYGDLFVAEGLVALASATGDHALRTEALDTLRRCVDRYDSPSYAPTIGQTYLGADAPPLPGARVLGVWMVLLRSATQLLETWPDDEYSAALADRCLHAILTAHLNPRFGLLNELLNHDLSRPRGVYEPLVYLGHAIELLWMVVDEARRRSDRQLLDRAAELFRLHCETAADREYGGLMRCLTDVDTGDRSSDKTLFVHQEALIGALLIAEETDSEWAVDFHRRIDAYTRSTFSLHQYGSPMWRVSGDRQMTTAPDERRVENYHHPRFLMLSLQSVRRMLAAEA